MSAQGTQKRAGLIPKMIVDVNGVPKKVWVRPEDLDGKQSNPKLRNLKPVLDQRLTEGLKHMKKGKAQDALHHTDEEKIRASERGYGTASLREAAERKFERDFGIPLKDAPPVELSDGELYDYLSRGVTVEHAHEFARFGIDPELAHPHLDAEYVFVSSTKVAKMDLKNQKLSDSPARQEELDDIKRTVHSLQEMGIDPYVAASCIANGLRTTHLNDKSRNLKDIIETSAQHNVESDRFKAIPVRPTFKTGLQGKLQEWGERGRRRAWSGTKRWARQARRRVTRNVTRRISRFLKLVFLPWKTR